MTRVVSLYGGPTGERAPVDNCVLALEELLAKARAGEVVGVAVACLHFDRLASYHVAGQVGGYGIIGALEVAKVDLLEICRG